MLDVLFVALLQVAAGDPTAAPPADTAPAADSATPGTAPAADQAQPAERRRCRRIRTTASKIAQRVCTTESEEENRANNARNTLNSNIARPEYLSANPISPGTR